jgi:Zn-finger protein
MPIPIMCPMCPMCPKLEPCEYATFLETIEGDCFVKCDNCRGIHNISDIGLVTDTIVLCRICSYRSNQRKEEDKIELNNDVKK